MQTAIVVLAVLVGVVAMVLGEHLVDHARDEKRLRSKVENMRDIIFLDDRRKQSRR